MLGAIQSTIMLSMLMQGADVASGSQSAPEPLTPPAEWVQLFMDYPPIARVLQLTGITDVELAVGMDGEVAGCRVVRSSNHDILDRATCRLAKERAKFRPARNATGLAAASVFSFSIRWEFENYPLDRADSNGSMFYLLREDDTLALCGTTMSPHHLEGTGFQNCIGKRFPDRALLDMLRRAGGAGNLRVMWTTGFALSPSSMKANVADQKGWRRVADTQSWLTVDASGKPMTCEISESHSESDFVDSICDSLYKLRFSPAASRDGQSTPARIGMSSAYYLEDRR